MITFRPSPTSFRVSRSDLVANVLGRFTEPLPVDAMRSTLNPLWTSQLRGVIESITPTGDTARTIRLRCNHEFEAHRAGQFVTVGVDVDGVRHHRSYSVSSAPAPIGVDRRARRTIEITVQGVVGGTVSTHLTSDARVGDIVHLTPPAGEFVLPDTPPGKLLFITAGSGITPVMSMLRHLARLAPHPDRCSVTMIHYAPSLDRTIFADELICLSESAAWLELHLVHTAGPGVRHLDRTELDRVCADRADRVTYACGPTGLLDTATDLWNADGIADLLHVEKFTTPSITAMPGDTHDGSGTAAFRRSGVTTTVGAGATILTAAEDAGVVAPSGCRTGVCHTCTAHLVSGCARDIRDGRITEAGSHVQICVSTPLGHAELDL